MIYPDGRVYAGEFREGKRIGYGTITHPNRFNQMFGFVAVKLQGHFNLRGVDAPLLAEINNINPGTRADGGQKQVIGLRGGAVSALVFGLIRFHRKSVIG